MNNNMQRSKFKGSMLHSSMLYVWFMVLETISSKQYVHIKNCSYFFFTKLKFSLNFIRKQNVHENLFQTKSTKTLEKHHQKLLSFHLTLYV